jgi:two-component system sensor histidine kinase/response regulator
LEKSKNLNDNYLNADIYYDFANCYYLMKNYSISKEYLIKALKLSKEIGTKSLIKNSYELLAKINFSLKDYKEAYNSQIIAGLYNDSLLNEDNQKNILNLQLKFDDNQKSTTIDYLHNERKQKETELKYLYALIGLGIIASILILILFYFRIRAKQKINNILKMKNEEIERVNTELKEQNQLVNKQKLELGRLIIDLKVSEEKYKAIFENSTIGLYRTTPEGRVLMANKTLAIMLGYGSPDEMMKLDLKQDNPYLDESRDKIIKDVLDAGFAFGMENRWYKKDGSEIYVRESVTVIKDEIEGNIYLEGVVEDITKSKLFEIALIESENKLKEALSSKDKFFSIIAHDLKNPLQALILSSDIIVNYYDKLSPDQLKDNTQGINKTSKNLSTLLENLLQWSRSQTGNIEFNLEINDINKEIIEIIHLLEVSAKNKSIEIQYANNQIPPFLYDKNMISTIIRNLISNSIKFTRDGGIIYINSGQIEYGNKKAVEISVVDNGVGINEDSLKRLFQIDSASSTSGTNNEKGTGLGLILCKEFVEKHNGTIWAESVLNEGSSFTFVIPMIENVYE